MRFIIALFLLITHSMPIVAQEDVIQQIDRLPWQRSGQFRIAEMADLQLSRNMRALNPIDANRFLELLGNLPRSNTYIVSADDLRWFTAFSFNPSGYVRDDEKIDADELLATLKRNNETGNVERQKRGLKPLYLQGWFYSPHYDVVTRRLEWATRLLSEGGVVDVNYTARILGRSGVMSATLVSQPDTLEEDVRSFHKMLQSLSFVGGQRYEEFRPGDKVAEYGLAALVVGGATAVAVKSGAGFLKIIGVAVVGFFAALFGAIKRLFRSKNSHDRP